MEFTAKFNNFGKIQDAILHFNDLTVLAGNNSTGKSYVSRALYCIFDALAKDPQKFYYLNLADKFAARVGGMTKLGNPIYRHSVSRSIYDDPMMKVIIGLVDQIDEIVSAIEKADKVTNGNMFNNEEYFTELFKPLLEEKSSCISKVKDLLKDKKDLITKDADIKAHIADFEKAYGELEERLDWPYEEKINRGYLNIITGNLHDNFQVMNLQELLGSKEGEEASIELDITQVKVSLKIGVNGILDGEVIINGIFSRPNVIYLASPIYWLVQRPLASLPLRRSLGNRKYLGGVPKYVHDSYSILGYESIDEPDAEVDTIAKGIEDEIGGEIKYDAKRKKLEFFEKLPAGVKAKGGISLLLTASGIVQLGMLAFFIKNRTINEETILFMDEPEAHLHTEWEEKIMEALYGLKDSGVQIILATHSPTIMQRLELDVKQNNSQDDVALNLCSKDGKFGNGPPKFETIQREIARSMNKAPYRMFLEE